MQTSNRLLDDLARLANGALGVAAGLRSEAEGMFRARLRSLLAEAQAVPRDEFEITREMAVRARLEQEALRERVSSLEARLAALEGSPGRSAAVPPLPRDPA
jgi:BMFP domain-containing protein YqiC